jgi:hypothetical protein
MQSPGSGHGGVFFHDQTTQRASGRPGSRGRRALSGALRGEPPIGAGLTQTTGYKDTTPWPGVVVRAYETPSMIPGFKTSRSYGNEPPQERRSHFVDGGSRRNRKRGSVS